MPSPRSKVFCDFFNVTVPKDNNEAVLLALQPFLAQLGCSLTAVGYTSPSGGLFSWRFRGQIVVYSGSGAFITALRDNGIFSMFLAEFAMFPHAVSSADFTCDEYVPAPLRLKAIFDLANTGAVTFTRKSVNPRYVRGLLRSPIYPDETGCLTGTIYIGQRGIHEVHAKIYDKRNEVLDKKGEHIGDCTRHELTVSRRMGITLRDLVEPASCFYHFYPSDLLEPEPFEPWSSMGFVGYELPKLETPLPAQVLRARAMDSPELRDYFRLADTIGSEGFKYLLNVIKQSYKSYQVDLSGTAKF